MKNFFLCLSTIFFFLSQAKCQYHFDFDMFDYSSPTQSSNGFQSSPHVQGAEDDVFHDCVRDCSRDRHSRKCYYQFRAEWYLSDSKACFDCPFKLSDCFRPHCNIVDGRQRPILTVNRRFPGPSIQVCEGDEIIVDLTAELASDTSSIHWHGLHQIGTQYMDGVPFITQCPILSGTTFRYQFLASPAGTHFWHSHTGFQRDDGMAGSLIVRSRNDSHAHLFDVDDPEHYMLVMDWLDALTLDRFLRDAHNANDTVPYNILVNGLGKYRAVRQKGRSAYTPLYEYRVKPGLRYRFRSISNAITNCPIEISIDNHRLLMIASDGKNIKPIEVDSFIINAGERYDFVVDANQRPGVYFVKFRGLIVCGPDFLSAHQVAVLRYEGAKGFPNSPREVNYDFTRRGGVQLNPLNAAPGDLRTTFTAADMRNFRELKEPSPFARDPDYTFYIDFDFYNRDDHWFHNPHYYPFFGVPEEERQTIPQMNNITYRPPNVPPLSQPEEIDEGVYCNAASPMDCERNFCRCTHLLRVELGSLVEMVLIDTGVSVNASHPFHLHGYVFAVLGMERLGVQTTVPSVLELERQGRLMRNFEHLPLKDTVSVPDGGYTVIRFIADNPGYWFFHCHVSLHLEAGMALIIQVGDNSDLPPVPKGFPRCGSFTPKPVDNLQAVVNQFRKFSAPSTPTFKDYSQPGPFKYDSYASGKENEFLHYLHHFQGDFGSKT